MLARAFSSTLRSRCLAVRATASEGSLRAGAQVTESSTVASPGVRSRRYDVPSQRSTVFCRRRRRAQTVRSSRSGGAGSIWKAARHRSLGSFSPSAPPSFSHRASASVRRGECAPPGTAAESPHSQPQSDRDFAIRARRAGLLVIVHCRLQSVHDDDGTPGMVHALLTD